MKLLFTILTLVIGFISYGQNNYSLQFDGIDDKLDLGYLDTLDSGGNITVEAWVKPYSVPAEDSNYDIFSLGGNGHFGLGYDNNSSFVFTLVFQNNNQLSLFSNTEYDPNSWYHVVGAYDSLNNMGYLYVNGVMVDSINTPDENLYQPNSINSNIGSYYQPFYGRYFHGAISSVHLSQDIIYVNNFCPNTTLLQTSNTIGLWLMDEGSGTNISDSVNSFDGTLNGPIWISDVPSIALPEYVPLSDLVGWWSFSGDANDLTSNHNDGTVNGATLTTDRFGCPNRAYSFDGIDNNIELLNPYFTGNTAVTEFTFSYWMYLNQLPQNSSNYYGILHFDSLWRQKFTGVDSDGRLNYSGANPNPNEYFGVTSSINTIEANQWYNVIVTYKNSTLSIYANGILTLSENISWSTLDFSKVISGNSNGKNLVGSRTSVSDGDYSFFNGKIDDIGVWNRALTNCEIQDISNSELNSTDNSLTATGSSIAANQEGATYQWLDCNNSNAPIDGEINKEYSPTETGTYAVIINYNGCILYSDCFAFEFLDINDELINDLKIFPNPTSDVIYIQGNNKQLKVVFYDLLGKEVIKESVTNNIEISNLEKGVYLMQLSDGTKVSTHKIIKN